MANGVLGAWSLLAGTNQAIYVNNRTDVAMMTINVCNQNHVPTELQIALSTSATSPSNSEWLEYDIQILGKAVYLRTGVAVSPGHYIVVQSSRPNVSAQAWGVEIGALSGSPVTLSQNSVAPTITTSASLPDITSTGLVEIAIEST